MKGWKGQRGAAILNNPNEAAFVRNLMTALVQAGDASIYALELDGRPVSLPILLRAGSAAYTWKAAYDKARSDFSPGMLLFEDYSKAIPADPNIVFADSCAFDDRGYTAAWTERKLVIDLWLDARRGGSALFAALAGLQRSYMPFREAAKQTYLHSAALQELLRSATAVWRTMQKRSGEPGCRSCRTFQASVLRRAMHKTDVAIVGGGLAGSLAAAMLGRAGIDCTLVDPQDAYPNDFRCEKLDGPQTAILEKTGFADAVRRASTFDGGCWVARFGRVIEKRPGDQHGILYPDLVNTIRHEVPASVPFIRAKAQSIMPGPSVRR